jgi:hypothetical protein
LALHITSPRAVLNDFPQTVDTMEKDLAPVPLDSNISAPPSEEVIDEKKLLRKLDWHIIPPLSLLYLLCYLDRT